MSIDECWDDRDGNGDPEAASENLPKRKCGRPRVIHAGRESKWGLKHQKCQVGTFSARKETTRSVDGCRASCVS
jgi:hypothetical protein